ncbi:MAG TPA: fibronectin type III domain-containing protein, partial [Vicinamibacterales bacterium]|nr:fibronectin type III domain-containing protein [Vicinamibacterales bacterium]
LSAEPIAGARFEDPIAEFGRERCYEVRALEKVGRFVVEGEPSPRACVTPRDTFPPAPPTGLTAVAAPGAVNLIWNPNTEKDLAGYVVLRGEAPGGTLQPLVTSPLAEPMYRDVSVTPGQRYVYAVVAVDRADPPNRSAPSPPVDVIAR